MSRTDMSQMLAKDKTWIQFLQFKTCPHAYTTPVTFRYATGPV